MLIQLSDLRAGCLRYADLEGAVGVNGRFTVAEVNNYVNRALKHVVRNIIVSQGQHHYLKDCQFIAAAQNVPGLLPPAYALPADCMQIVSVGWANQNSGPWAYLERCEEAERFDLISAGYWGGLWPAAYAITGASSVSNTGNTQGTIPTAQAIEILPAAPLGSTIWLRYVPTPPELQNDTDTFDGIVGYEEAVMLWAAILMRRKDDLPTEELERDMGLVLAEMRQITKSRDRSSPPRVSMVRNRAGSRTSRRGRGFPWSF